MDNKHLKSVIVDAINVIYKNIDILNGQILIISSFVEGLKQLLINDKVNINQIDNVKNINKDKNKKSKTYLDEQHFKYEFKDVFPMLGLKYTKVNEELILSLGQTEHPKGGIFDRKGNPLPHLFHNYHAVNKYNDDGTVTIIYSDKFLKYMATKLHKIHKMSDELYLKIHKMPLKYNKK